MSDYETVKAHRCPMQPGINEGLTEAEAAALDRLLSSEYAKGVEDGRRDCQPALDRLQGEKDGLTSENRKLATELQSARARFTKTADLLDAQRAENTRLVKAWEDRDHERFLMEERAEVAEAENTRLRAALNPGGQMFDAMAEVMAKRDQLRAVLERLVSWAMEYGSDGCNATNHLHEHLSDCPVFLAGQVLAHTDAQETSDMTELEDRYRDTIERLTIANTKLREDLDNATLVGNKLYSQLEAAARENTELRGGVGRDRYRAFFADVRSAYRAHLADGDYAKFGMAVQDIIRSSENTEFPLGTIGRTDGLTDDMGG